MAELRAAFERIGFADVATYIQSGNVIFAAPRQSRAALAAQIESGLSRQFGADLRIVLLSAAALRRVVAEAPPGFGAPTHRADVLFLRPPLTARRAFSLVELKDGVDRAWPGPGVIYFERLAARASSSRLSRLVGRPEYREMTVRNWSTTTKLLERIGR